MKWNVFFFQTDNGKIPVKEFLDSLEAKHKAKAIWEISLLEEYGIHLKEPYVRSIKGKKYSGIKELRIKFADNISRIFYFLHIENTFILLHGFVKKTEKTPTNELDKALEYMKQCIRRSGRHD